MILTSCYPNKQNHLTTPPPTECGWLIVTGEAEHFLHLLNPLNLAGLRRSRKISATTPPPLNLPGLRRSRKISATTPPPTESGPPPEITENWPPPKKNPGCAVGCSLCLPQCLKSYKLEAATNGHSGTEPGNHPQVSTSIHY